MFTIGKPQGDRFRRQECLLRRRLNQSFTIAFRLCQMSRQDNVIAAVFSSPS